MNIILPTILAAWLLIRFSPAVQTLLQKLFRSIKGHYSPTIFEHHYLEGKAFYLDRFKMIPCTTYIDDVDVTKAFARISDTYKEHIVDIYQACHYNREEGRQEFSATYFVLNNKVVIELRNSYAKMLFPNSKYGFVDNLINVFSEFKLPEKQEDFEINIITFNNGSLELKRLDIKPTQLDIELYYNDDFKEVDETIRSRLNQQNDKGIVLLHGLPGTGKTTYLRHLIGELKKKVLFVSPSVAGNLMNPEFIDLLIDNPNAVLIIEDAENIMMDRKYNSDSSVSNLLNLSDGLLSDCLSVQIICTFNSSLNMIDSALMRKGRLIAKYEFGKLSLEKSRRLSNHLGFNTLINQPMTLAEIANQNDKQYEIKRVEVVGFKRPEVTMN
jgi:hypothetical protein